MKGPIARATLRTVAVFALRFVLQAVTLLLVTYMLGPVAYGTFAGVMGLAIFLGALAGCGMPLMQMRAFAFAHDGNGVALPYAVPTVLLVGVGMYLFFVPLCLLLFSEGTIGIGTLLALGLAELVMQPLLVLFAAEWHGRGEVARAQLLQVVPLALRTAAAGVVALSAFSSPLPAYSVAYLAATFIALVFARRGVEVAPVSHWRFPMREEWREALGYAAVEVSRNGPTELDKTVAAHSLAAHGAGLYASGARVVAAAVLPVMAMVVSALPRLFRETTGPALLRLVAVMSIVALCYGLALAAILWIGAPWLDALLDSQYAGIGSMVRSMCLVVPGLALRLVMGNVLVAIGRPWRRVGVEVFGVVVLVFVGGGLSSHMGPAGMVLTLAFSEWGMALISGGLVACHFFARRNVSGGADDGN